MKADRLQAEGTLELGLSGPTTRPPPSARGRRRGGAGVGRAGEREAEAAERDMSAALVLERQARERQAPRILRGAVAKASSDDSIRISSV